MSLTCHNLADFTSGGIAKQFSAFDIIPIKCNKIRCMWLILLHSRAPRGQQVHTVSDSERIQRIILLLYWRLYGLDSFMEMPRLSQVYRIYWYRIHSLMDHLQVRSGQKIIIDYRKALKSNKIKQCRSINHGRHFNGPLRLNDTMTHLTFLIGSCKHFPILHAIGI